MGNKNIKPKHSLKSNSTKKEEKKKEEKKQEEEDEEEFFDDNLPAKKKPKSDLKGLEFNPLISQVRSDPSVDYTNSLISLDLHDFYIPSITNVNDMFKNCNENLIYCLKIENREQILNKLVNQLSPSNENCSLICIEYLNSKYIFDENRCVNSCFDEVSYKFEYNNICLLSCPERTHNPPGQPFLCQNDILACDAKCSNCTFESEDIGLCITCNTNENYFPKINDPSNINGFINCYNDIEGYFIDFIDRIFKNCFSNCKNCEEFNGEERNKCYNCLSDNVLNYKFCFEICDYNYDKCSMKDKKYFPLSNPNSDTTLYSYEVNSDLDDLKEKNKNVTFVYLSPEIIKLIMDQFNLDEEKDKLVVMISDYPTDDTQKATNDFDYRIFLENGTELNLSNLKEDLYTEVYTPIKDLDLAKFNYTKLFSEQGFDIYDKESEFYNDFCTPASVGENDITLEDRKKEIFPENVTLCKENCYYDGVNVEEERVICKCNLKSNNDISDSNEEENLEEDNGNYITYLLDNINYKIFKCYRLLSDFNNLKNNYAFYVIAGVFLVLLFFDLMLFIYTLPTIKSQMFNDAPTKERVREETKKELIKFKKRIENTSCNPPKSANLTSLLL